MAPHTHTQNKQRGSWQTAKTRHTKGSKCMLPLIAMRLPTKRRLGAFVCYLSSTVRGSMNETTVFDKLVLHHITAPIDSTQDVAKRLLETHEANHRSSKAMAVLADIQLNGRGTNGRKWERATSELRADGNLYMTVCVPASNISKLHLLPLQIAVFVAQLLTNILHETTATVHVKWPNDVLVDDKKISGTLIENVHYQQSWMLIGIGLNVQKIPETTITLDRAAASLQDYHDNTTMDHPPSAHSIGVQLAQTIADTTLYSANVIDVWKAYAQFGQSYTLRNTGETVVVLDIQPDGQLRVRQENGQERLLVAEYMV